MKNQMEHKYVPSNSKDYGFYGKLALKLAQVLPEYPISVLQPKDADFVLILITLFPGSGCVLKNIGVEVAEPELISF